MSAPTPITSPLLLAEGFTHGFFTREGGCSDGTFRSLNCSFSVGDPAENVRENLRRVTLALELQPEALITVSQVHGSTVVKHDAQRASDEFALMQADALIGKSAKHGLSVRTADCVPILIGCRRTGLAAAIHAGWRGLVARIIEQTIRTLMSYGSTPDRLVAAIGPHIGVDAFEVSDEVAQSIENVSFGAPSVARSPNAKPHVSLETIASEQLYQAGVPRAAIDSVCPCTYSNAQYFFSFRRDGKASGRQVSAIVPR